MGDDHKLNLQNWCALLLFLAVKLKCQKWQLSFIATVYTAIKIEMPGLGSVNNILLLFLATFFGMSFSAINWTDWNVHNPAYVFWICLAELHNVALGTVQLPRLFKSFEFGNGSRMSDENLVILEFKYLQNKKC